MTRYLLDIDELNNYLLKDLRFIDDQILVLVESYPFGDHGVVREYFEPRIDPKGLFWYCHITEERFYENEKANQRNFIYANPYLTKLNYNGNYDKLNSYFKIMHNASMLAENAANSCLQKVNFLVLQSKFEAQAIDLIKKILTEFINTIKLSKNLLKENNVNELQIHLIKTYLKSYKQSFNEIIFNFQEPYPSISNYFKSQNIDLLNDNNKIEFNNFPGIFRSKEGLVLFEKMDNFYKNKSNELANYSFLFYALDNDKYLVCSQKEFLEFLENRSIILNKIDSRQSGMDNKRRDLYDSIRKSI